MPKLRAYENAAEAGKQDLVVLAVKSYDLDRAVQHIDDLLGPETMVMTVQNGIPWWYFQREGGKFEGQTLTSLDPNGILALAVDAKRIIGSVAYPAAALGRARHGASHRGRPLSRRRARRKRDRARDPRERSLHPSRTEVARDLTTFGRRSG